MLGVELNHYFEKQIKKEIQTKVDRDQEEKEIYSTHWTLPSHIIVFLEEKIENLAD